MDVLDSLRVLLSKESNEYATSDYLFQMSLGSGAGDESVDSDDGLCVHGGGDPEKGRCRERCDDFQYVGGEAARTGRDEATAQGPRSDDDVASFSQINQRWRETICEWAYQVVDHFDLNREVVSVAMSNLDRCLATCASSIDKQMFQLLAMTCLYLAVKLNEFKHLMIPGTSSSSMETILKLSRGFFTLQQMERMEIDVLRRLEWHVHPPTPQVFVKYFLFFTSPEEQRAHDLALFLVELSVLDYFFVPYKPSEVAHAALLLAIDEILPRGMDSTAAAPLPFERHGISPASRAVQECRERLALVYTRSSESADNVASETIIEADHRNISPVSVTNTIQIQGQHITNHQRQYLEQSHQYSQFYSERAGANISEEEKQQQLTDDEMEALIDAFGCEE